MMKAFGTNVPLFQVFLILSIVSIVLMLLLGVFSEIPVTKKFFSKSGYTVSFENYVLSPLSVSNALSKIKINGKPLFDQLVGIAVSNDQTELWNANIEQIQNKVDDFMKAYGLYCYKITLKSNFGEKTIAEAGTTPYDYETIYVDIPYAGRKITLNVGVCGFSNNCMDCSDVSSASACLPSTEKCQCTSEKCDIGKYCYGGSCYNENPLITGTCQTYGGTCIDENPRYGVTCKNEKIVKAYSSDQLCKPFENEMQRPVCCCPSNKKWDSSQNRCVVK